MADQKPPLGRTRAQSGGRLTEKGAVQKTSGTPNNRRQPPRQSKPAKPVAPRDNQEESSRGKVPVSTPHPLHEGFTGRGRSTSRGKDSATSSRVLPDEGTADQLQLTIDALRVENAAKDATIARIEAELHGLRNMGLAHQTRNRRTVALLGALLRIVSVAGGLATMLSETVDDVDGTVRALSAEYPDLLPGFANGILQQRRVQQGFPNEIPQQNRMQQSNRMQQGFPNGIAQQPRMQQGFPNGIPPHGQAQQLAPPRQ